MEDAIVDACHLAAIMDSVDDAIVRLTPDGAVQRWSRGAAKLWGYDASEIIGQPIFSILKEKELSRGPLAAHPAVSVAKDGTRIPVLLTTAPVRDEEGVVLSLSLVARDAREREEAGEQLHRLSAQLLNTQDEERRRIARELHDTTGQDLAALAMRLSSLEDSPAHSRTERETVAASVALAEQCLHDVRTLAYILHPPLLDELGLASALRIFVDGFAERTGIPVKLRVPATFERLSRHVELAVFRVAQEALSNVHRHSGSQSARVRLGCEGGKLRLEVADRGHGIPRGMLEGGCAAGHAPGVGLLGMGERARELGGSLEIESGRTGTCVRLTIPLKGNRAGNRHEQASHRGRR